MLDWQNFDVEIFDHDKVGNTETVRVRVVRSPAGDQRDAKTMTIPPSLRDLIGQLEQDALQMSGIAELGKQLAQLLIPSDAARLFEKSRAQLTPQQGLRLRIELRALALADFPWEYLYWVDDCVDEHAPERGFLGINRRFSIIRYEAVAQAATTCKPLRNESVTIAMLLANPDIPGWAKLDLGHEAQIVNSALSQEQGISVLVHEKTDVTVLNAVLDDAPHIVHFSGHGRFKLQPASEYGVYVGQGQLLLENADGSMDSISANELATKMRGTGVRLAILNSCESARRDSQRAFGGIAPTLVRDGVPAVVAMQYNIRDSHAVIFSRRFYHNVARHKSIDEAVTAARIAMFEGQGQKTRDWGIPVVYLRSDETVLFPDPELAQPRASLQTMGKRMTANLLLSTVVVFALAIFYLSKIKPLLELGNVVGGVLAVAAIAAMSYLMTMGGEALRSTVLNWLRRPVGNRCASWCVDGQRRVVLLYAFVGFCARDRWSDPARYLTQTIC